MRVLDKIAAAASTRAPRARPRTARPRARSTSTAPRAAADRRAVRSARYRPTGHAAYGWAMRVLVTGGAGYIGSHTVVQLRAAGHEVVVVDNFSNSKPTVVARLEALTGGPLEVHAFDLTDRDKVESLFAERKFDAVVHFAGLKAVGESVDVPLEYYQTNLDSTFALVRAMSGTAASGWSSRRRPRSTARRDAAVHRGPADLGDEPVRLDQGDDRADAARRRPHRRPVADRAAALLQPGRRTRVRARSARTRPGSPTT